MRKIYDGTTSATLTAPNYLLAGVLAGNSVSLNDPSSGTYDDPHAGSGLTVTVSGLGLTGSDAGNYTIAGVVSGAVGQIDPRPITVTADDASKLLNAPDPTFTFTITSGSLVAGDSLSGVETRQAGEAAGQYPIQQGTLAASSDYDVTFVDGVFTIGNSTPQPDLQSSLFIDRPCSFSNCSGYVLWPGGVSASASQVGFVITSNLGATGGPSAGSAVAVNSASDRAAGGGPDEAGAGGGSEKPAGEGPDEGGASGGSARPAGGGPDEGGAGGGSARPAGGGPDNGGAGNLIERYPYPDNRTISDDIQFRGP